MTVTALHKALIETGASAITAKRAAKANPGSATRHGLSQIIPAITHTIFCLDFARRNQANAPSDVSIKASPDQKIIADLPSCFRSRPAIAL